MESERETITDRQKKKYIETETFTGTKTEAGEKESEMNDLRVRELEAGNTEEDLPNC